MASLARKSDKAVRPARRRARKAPSIRSETADLITKQALIGWREWLALPELKIERIRAKIDTGARTSALHATEIVTFTRDGERWVSFTVKPRAGGARDRAKVTCEARLLDRRKVKNSGGGAETRCVIATPVVIGRKRFEIEITLADRAEMGFEMLFGRTALRKGRFLVHPSRSFLLGRK